MKLGELFIKLGVIGDTKKLDKAVKSLEKAEKIDKRKAAFKEKIQKLNKLILEATNEEQKKELQTLKIKERDNYVSSVRLENFKKQQSALSIQNKQWMAIVKGVGAFIAAATLAYKAVDRMVSSLAQANQQMISFQRQTGISFKSLNKYASANAAVNYNSTIEGTAQSMQRLSQNLWDIRMGRGDISPYQELAFVGGKAFNPMGMNVEQVIESVREAIKGVDDIQATNIITRMGFAPDDLLMLRMSREEFEKINNLFLSPEQREAMNKYALELKKTKLEFELFVNKVIIKVAPAFIKLTKILINAITLWGNFARLIVNTVKACTALQNVLKGIGVILLGVMFYLHPVIAAFSTLYLIIEDIAGYFLGYKSVTGAAVNGFKDLMAEFSKEIDTSNVKTFFKTLNDELIKLSNLSLPAWLIGLFTGNPFLATSVDRSAQQIIDVWKEVIDTYKSRNNLSLLPTENLTPINTNTVNTSNNNNTFNTNNNFSITTNQPVDLVAENLANKFMPTQVQYGIAAG